MDLETDGAFVVTFLTAPDAPSTLIVLEGDIDITATAALAEVLTRLAVTAADTVVLDLAQIGFAGATLLNFVADVRRGLPANATLSLCRPSAATRRLLTVACMDQIAILRADLPALPPSSSAQSRESKMTTPTPLGRGPLETAITALAGTPDHYAGMDERFLAIATLTAKHVAAARYASVTALRGRAYLTVAVNDDLIRSVDDAQYAGDSGPCLEALITMTPVGVPDLDTTVQWPGFHEAAARMGLHASVSVPLFAGSGDAVATLNVYSHDRAAMAPLIVGICAAHERPGRAADQENALLELDAGGRELVAGYAEALGIRATIQLAIEFIKSDNHCGGDDAYLSLCIQAAEAGTDLGAAAATVIIRR